MYLWWCSFFTRLRKHSFRIVYIFELGFSQHKQRKMLAVIKSNTTTICINRLNILHWIWHDVEYYKKAAYCNARKQKNTTKGKTLRECVAFIWFLSRIIIILKPYRSAAARHLFKFLEHIYIYCGVKNMAHLILIGQEMIKMRPRDATNDKLYQIMENGSIMNNNRPRKEDNNKKWKEIHEHTKQVKNLYTID